MRSDYKRWRNFGQAGELSFLTTTTLDFNRVFDRPEMKEEMLHSLFSDCRHYGADIHAFVVMVHHIHALIRAPVDRHIRWLSQRIKANSAKHLLPLLTREEQSGFDEQRHLNGHLFWKKSFRSVIIDDPRVFWQKTWYIHLNPVKAGLCSEPEEYRWSSATCFRDNLYDPVRGLPLDLF